MNSRIASTSMRPASSFDRSGVSTGFDLDKLVAANAWFAGVMGKELPGMVGRAGPFPRVV